MFGLGQTTRPTVGVSYGEGYTTVLTSDVISRYTAQAADRVLQSQAATTSNVTVDMLPGSAPRWFGPVAAVVAGVLVFTVGYVIVRRGR